MIKLFQHFSIWATRVGLRNKLAVLLVSAALATSLATYAALTQKPFFGTDPQTVTFLLTLDLVILVLLGSLVIQRLVGLIRKWRRNQAGSRLHVKIVSVFSLLAAAPAVIVAMFAVVFFYYGVETWFSTRVRTALDESLQVAQAYLKEHKQVLRADALSMANDLNREAMRLSEDPVRFSQAVSAQAYMRSLTEVIVFDGSGKILARSGLTFALSFEPITDEMRDRAKEGEVVLLVGDGDDRVRALLRLDNFVDTYLFVGRLVDPIVLEHMTTTQNAVNDYRDINLHSRGIKLMISSIFVAVALLLLTTAVWFGMNFASRLVRPISALINAADRIRAGDLTTRVTEQGDSNDEIDTLGRSFNRMTDQLASQRAELVEANRQLDLRRRFTEAVLSGVSAGVIGLDRDYNVHLMNLSAMSFFQMNAFDEEQSVPLEKLAPEIHDLLMTVPRGSRLSEGRQVEIHKVGSPTRTLLVRLSSELQGGEIKGYVVTFDDVSDLVSAQRKAAWADVARRIAHEIKNPLTPIQLAAERIRRKYRDEIKTDPEVFQTCTDTIVRHVEDIGRMVDEFSAFARMPTPVMRENDLSSLCRETVFMQSSSRSDIHYRLHLPSEPVCAVCDGRQIAQGLTNLLKNAAEAIDARDRTDETAPPPKGEITLTLSCEKDKIVMSVADNGKGLPVEDRNRLTEPYVTTRAKGTGLGLAIVKKIMEDHQGDLNLTDREGGGAVVTLSWNGGRSSPLSSAT